MNVIFFDIDGTLANGLEVPKSAQLAIHKLRDNGNIIFICTGRALPYVKKHFYKYANGYISNNGRYAMMGCCEVLYSAPIKNEIIDRIIQSIQDKNVGVVFFSTKQGCYIGSEEGYSSLSSLFDKGMIQKGYPKESVYSCDIYYKNKDIKQALEEEWKDICLLNPHGPHPSADITILGSDKGDAIRSVAQYLQVPIENTYAFGDGINDISMLKAAGHGIAMGNACNEVKEVAEYITTDINDDGVYNACKHFGLIKE